MENILKKWNSKWFLLFLFTFFSIGMQAQYSENEELNAWIAEALEQDTDSHLEANEDGDLVGEITYIDTDYEDYLDRTDCENLCQEGHTNDPNTVGNEHVVITVIEIDDDGWGAFYDDYNDWIALMEQEEQEALDDYYDSLVDDELPPPDGFSSDLPPDACITVCPAYFVADSANCQCVPLPRPWYFDNDGDEWHDKDTVPKLSIDSPGSSWIKKTLGKDCDDNDITVKDNCYKNYYIDNDGDDWDSGTINAINDNGGKYKLTTLGTDCDDTKPSANNICSDDCKTSKEDLQKLFPTLSDAKATQLANTLNKYSKSYGIDTKEKLQHFLAQAGVETANFNSFGEGTNFQPSVVMGTFGKYFNDLNKDNKDLSKANLSSIYNLGQKYVNGEQLFNIVYDDRNLNRSRKSLNGNIYDGDGYLFRGRGALHLTGREKYTDFTTFYNQISGNPPKDFTKTPDDLKNDFDIAIHAGLWYFQKNVLKEISNFQQKATNSSSLIRDGLTIKVSTIVNGGSNALDKRIKKFDDSKTTIKCN